MATYVMFGNFNAETAKVISGRRTEDALALVKKFGGEWKTGYALLGEVDFVAVVDLPDTQHAMQLTVALSGLLGFRFRAMPAVPIQEFDKLMG